MDMSVSSVTTTPQAGALPASVKSSVKRGTSYASSTSRDIHIDMDTSATPTTPQPVPFVRLGSLANDDLENEVSQRSATISFWFPRRAHRTQRPALAHRHVHRRDRAAAGGDRDSSSAIQGGSPIDIFSCRKLGLLLTYGAIGYFDGVLPLLARVLFKDASRQALQLSAARHALLLARLMFAVGSDVVLPASKHRRRVWLVAGWLLLFTLCVALASLTVASTSINQYLPLLLLLPVGPVVASVSADALMVEYAHREDIHERGCIQMLLLATRTVGELIGRSSMSTGNEPTAADGHTLCKGELDCVVAPKYNFMVAAVVALGALLSAAFLTHIPSRRRLVLQGHPATTPLQIKLGLAWTAHQNPMYLAFVAFGLLQAASFAWSTPRAHELATLYVRISDATQWISDGVGLSLRMVAALLLMSLWRNTPWRLLTLVLVAVSTLCTRVPSDVLVLLNVSRDQTLFLGLHHVAALAEHLMTMIRLLVAVELATPTMEATSFALTTSAFDLGTIVGSFISTRITASRPVAIVTSAPAPQSITIVCIVLYVVRVIVDVGSLKLLPIQKHHVQEERRAAAPRTIPSPSTTTPSTKPSLASGVALGTLLLLLLVAVVLMLASLIQGTSEVAWINNTLLSE